MFALTLLALANASFAQTGGTPSVLPRPDFYTGAIDKVTFDLK
jgi:hypothetical protein